MHFQASVNIQALREAWLATLRKGGGPGGDGETIAEFARAAEPRLARLSHELEAGLYLPGPIRRHPIPKRSGGTRWLSIPCVVDRIAQRAATKVLTEVLEPEFEDSSYAYRPGRSVKQAVERVDLLRRQGYRFVVDADIKAYFDNVPHHLLLDKLDMHKIDPRLVDLVRLWLRGFSDGGKGLAQGSPLSPLLANLYLDEMDETFAKGNVRIVRFADDFVLLTKTRPGAEGALEKAASILAAHGLEFNLEKTRIVPFEASFDFLGHIFMRSLVLKKENDDEPVEPRNQLSGSTPQQQPPSIDQPSWKDAEPAPEAPPTLIPVRARKPDDPLDGLAEDRDEQDYASGLAPLYVLEPGRHLAAEGEGFSVWNAGRDNRSKPILRVPARLVGRIDLGPEVEAEDAALRLAAANRIPVSFLNGSLEPESVLLPAVRSDAGLHLAQARLSLDETIRRKFAAVIVSARVRNAQALLKRLNRRRQLASVESACQTMHYGWRKAETATDFATVVATEAECARVYWPALGACIMHGFRLDKRRYDVGENPVASVLDFTAHLLTRDMRSAALRARLHPGLGALHAASDGNEACVYDLIEPFRAPLSEGLTVYLFNNRILMDSDFLVTSDGLRLTGSAGRKLVQTWESWLARPVKDPVTGRTMPWRSLLLVDARRFARAAEAGEPPQLYLMKH